MDVRQRLNQAGQHPFVADRPVVRQFIKFGLVGVVNTLTSFTIYFILTRARASPPLVANAVAFVIAVTVSFYLNKRWTFKETTNVSVRQYSKFFGISMIGLGLSELIIGLLHHVLGWPDIIAFFSAVIIVMFWNFGANRWWTFKLAR